MRYVTTASHRGHPDSRAWGMARGLGWFSLALGAMEVLAPRALARSLGMDGRERTVLAYGLREIATGVGILTAKDPTPWIWGRVGGDALDLATLGAGLRSDNPKRQNVGLAMLAVIGVTAMDLHCARALTRDSATPIAPIRDYSDRTGFARPPAEMRGAARDFEVPRDFRTPEALRPLSTANYAAARPTRLNAITSAPARTRGGRA